MALSKSLTLKSNFQTDVVFENCYIKLTNLTGNKYGVVSTFFIYTKQEGEFLKEINDNFTPDLSETNFISQAYAHLKTLPEYADAVDC